MILGKNNYSKILKYYLLAKQNQNNMKELKG